MMNNAFLDSTYLLHTAPKPRPRLQDRLLGVFSISLERDMSEGHNKVLNLGDVEAKVYSKGLDHNKIFVICYDDDKAIFVADAPKADVAGEEMFGNTGYEPTVVWQAKK